MRKTYSPSFYSCCGWEYNVKSWLKLLHEWILWRQNKKDFVFNVIKEFILSWLDSISWNAMLQLFWCVVAIKIKWKLIPNESLINTASLNLPKSLLWKNNLENWANDDYIMEMMDEFVHYFWLGWRCEIS